MDQAIPAGAKRLLIAGLGALVALLAVIAAYGIVNADAAGTASGVTAPSYEAVQSETPEATPPAERPDEEDCPKGGGGEPQSDGSAAHSATPGTAPSV